MSDQAETLRRLMEQRGSTSDESGAMPHVFVVSSAQTGIGKTWLVANLGALLAHDGLRVLLIDADHQNRAEAEAAATSETDPLLQLEERLWLLPMNEMSDRADSPADGQDFDVVLIDANAASGKTVVSMDNASFRNVILLTPDPSGVADAYNLVSSLRRRSASDCFGVVVNQVTDGGQAREAFRRLATATDQYLDIQLDYLGHIARDENFTRAVVKPKSLVNLGDGPVSGVTVSLELLAKRFRETCSDRQVNMKGFWRTLMGP